MGFRVLEAGDAYWRPSNQMGVLNTDLAKQLAAAELGARLWRLMPGQASTRQRHRAQRERGQRDGLRNAQRAAAAVGVA